MRNAIILSSALGYFAVGAISLPGCDGGTSGTGGDGGGGGGAVTVESACKSLAASLCGRIGTCAPFILENGYGGTATCEERVGARCVLTPDLSGVTFSPEAIQACASAYDGLGCDDVLTSQTPDACRPAGDKADGASCAVGAECQGAHCITKGEGQCGTCATALAEGATCDVATDVCGAGMFCSAAGTCAKPGDTGDPCSSTQPCGGLSCNGGTCGALLAEGADCSSGETCDVTVGLYCKPAAKTCAKIGVAKLGEACGYDDVADEFTACEADVECDFAANKCIARLKEGDSCALDAQTGTSHCATGLQCISGTCSFGYPSCQ